MYAYIFERGEGYGKKNRKIIGGAFDDRYGFNFSSGSADSGGSDRCGKSGNCGRKKNKVIEVKEITENSIVFAVSEGRVYAIKVKDEKDSTKDVWKWAVETQYDTEAKTVRFEGLTAGTEYEFACAVEETQTPQETEKVCTKAPEKESVKESSESKATESKQPESKVTESKQSESKTAESKQYGNK